MDDDQIGVGGGVVRECGEGGTFEGGGEGGRSGVACGDGLWLELLFICGCGL